MGRIRRGRVGMPKIKKTKVAPSGVAKNATAKAKKLPAKPPQPNSSPKPTARLPAVTSPGRKKLTEAKHAIKEARREYLLLARAAKKLEKLRDRKHELVDKHAAAAERALKLPVKKAPRLNMLALSNAESGWLLALAQAYAARLKAAWAWDLVRIAQIEQKRAEIERLRRRLWWPRV